MAKTKSNANWIGLLQALQFIAVAQRAVGNDMERHCMLYAHYATAFNGLIAAGMRIEEDLQCCPHTVKLIAALENCGEGYNIGHVAQDRLMVASGDFTASIPLIDGSVLQWAMPDPKQIVVDDTLKAAMFAVVGVVNDKAERVHESAVLMQSRTCAATDGIVILEAWHGWDLPPNILLPKACVVALNKARKQLIGIGFGDTTVTFWFEDQSWIRTQRYLAEWPKSTLLKTMLYNFRELPPSLFIAAHKLAPFSEDGNLYCWQNKARSHPFSQANAFTGQLSADVEGVTESRIYKLATLFAIQSFATQIDDSTMRNRSFVSGIADVKIGTKKAERMDIKVRGVFSHSSEGRDVGTGKPEIEDDDIPF